MASKKYQITQLQEAGDLLVLHPETSADIVVETSDKKIMTSIERTKLQGVENGAQVNKIETIKVNGAPVNIVDKAVDIKIDGGKYIPLTEKAQPNGVATLDELGKVPTSQLPSYVDDVLEFANKTGFPSSGETGKIYIAKDTNLTYRWSGTAYVEISASLALGETSSTAYSGNKGKKNADDIATLNGKVAAVEAKNEEQDRQINAIENGTTKVGKATTADTATSAGKLTTVRNIAIKGDATGNTNFDGSANVSITLALSNVGTAGTYSAVTTDAKGRVVAGAQVFEVGKTGQSTPNQALAVGGLFYKEI